MVFYTIFGWFVFWISLILAVIAFIVYRKVYPVMYLVSVALYVFTAGYMIDVFEIGKLGILLTLLFSALIFMGLGYYLSQVLPSPVKRK